ncbi:hypothetical protein GJ699_03755 [Duganella sp. FT80W]|uniref:Tetratricopeptide repeat protein n=1 Tax=Duganella guangzhouensis TaxID=2666084 RepID=A0A6I2KTK3_9BURK|nr:hypothetical protein [Duganella guangzhouensis]MRW89093.1 hypothetical protein [Duganella guangzhouensis]
MRISSTWLPCCASLLLLSACATDGATVRSERPQPVTLERALADADAALAAGHNDKAHSILKAAAADYPADKTPWLHMAQIKFDRASYGEAIMNALEALQRDPNDKLGSSIVAVSGLRLSTKALADLSQQNNLSGSLRTEAQELAKLLRTTLVEDVLVPNPNASRKPAASAPAASKKSTTSKNSNQSNNSDPFGGLK